MKIIFPFSGHLAMLIYVLTTSLSGVLIHETNQTTSPILSAFYTFLFCIVIYGSLSTNLFKKINLLRKYWLPILVLNISTAICWIFTFIGLKFVSPDLFLFIYLCSMTISSSLINKMNYLNNSLFFLALILLSLTYPADNLLLGFFLAFSGGIAGTIYSIYSKKISRHFTTLEILSLRFYLIVIISFFINIHFDLLHTLSFYFYFKFIILSLISIIIPLILFQIGIKKLNVSSAMYYLPLAPLLCYVINLYHKKIDVLQLSIIIFLFSLMIFNFINLQREKSI